MSWTTRDLLSLDWCRWREYHGTQQVMNGALGHVPGGAGFPAGAVRLFGLLATGGAAGADLLLPSRGLTISAVSTTMASHRAEYRAWPR
jgi:hypothetical protein